MEPKTRSRAWESRNLGTIDFDTGEVVPGFIASLPPRVPKVYVGEFVQTLQQAAKAVAMDQTITPTALRVLKYLEAILDYESAIRVVQADVARELGYHQPDVNKAFRLLLNKGIIERIESPSLKAVYRLNPRYGFKGHLTKWEQAIPSASPLRLLKGGKTEKKPEPEVLSESPEEAAKEAKALELLDQFERNEAIERQRELDALGEPRLF